MSETSTPIKVGIAGLGRAGIGMHSNEIQKYTDKFEVVAGCDIDTARLPVLEEKFPGCKTYPSLDEMLKDDNVELVSIATRSPDHVDHAIMALEAGKYVFLEKPIATRYEDALRLKATAEKYPGKLYLRHNRRFEPMFQHIREIMASGILGEVFEIKLRRNGYQRRNDWQTIIACGGGQLNNWGPHIIDHGLRLLESTVKSIWGDLKKVAAVGDAEDHLKVILTGENGRIVDLEISGGSAIGEPIYIVSGSKGVLTGKGNELTLRYINPEQQLEDIEADPASPPIDASFGNKEVLDWIEETIEVNPSTQCQMDHIWLHLFDAIKGINPFPITLEEGLEVVKVSTEVKKGTEFAG